MSTRTLNTTHPFTTDALAEVWHLLGMNHADHILRACSAQSQAEIWSDIAQWVTYLAGRPLPLDERGAALLAEAMHADCWRIDGQRTHTLIQCASLDMQTGFPPLASALIAALVSEAAPQANARG